MTDAGVPPFQDDPTVPEPPKQRRLLGVIIAVVVVLALVAGGLAAFLLLRDDEKKPSYPQSWDPRIAPYVKIVEKQRGLTFVHPVEVRFLDAAAFEDTVRTDQADLDKDERAEVDQITALFRAFGLIAGDVNLFDAFNDASGSGTLAYYSFDDERITVKGTELTLAVHATLVHELTHALQDQRFHIGYTLDKLSTEAEAGAVSTAYDALDAIVEGDAERTADLYRKTLTPAQRKALEAAENTDQSDADKGLEKVPGIVLTLIGAPYALGQALTEAVVAHDKDDIDDLFTDPPTNDSVLLDPITALSGHTDAEEVGVPALADGEAKVDTGQIGALTTYLILAQRLPLKDALAAADGWDGDAYVSFTRNSTTCARISYAGDTGTDTQRLQASLQRWIRAVPGTKATVARDGERVLFESCDPGTGMKKQHDSSQDALGLIATRAYLGAELLKEGAPADVSDCFARAMVAEYSVADLNNPTYGQGDPRVRSRIEQIVRTCAE